MRGLPREVIESVDRALLCAESVTPCPDGGVMLTMPTSGGSGPGYIHYLPVLWRLYQRAKRRECIAG
jgi:hypothetical protein